MFLITGFPRSGTKYLATVLNAVGLDVGHEELRPDGTVSWPHIGQGFLTWTGQIEKTNFDPVIHVVRDPLKAISSAQTLRDESFDYMFKYSNHPGGPRGLRWYMWAWLKWNDFIESRAVWRFKIEDLPECYPTLFEMLGIQGVSALPELPKNINTRPHSNFTWTDLKREDKKLYKQIRDKAVKYGYQIDRQGELPKISAIMMMKNEAHNLRRCLDSIKWVDEICIVDTGSTDDSIEIAREYGAKIMESPWRDDFSFHRNQSASLASGDWLLLIDCDEQLFMDDPRRFKIFLSSLGDDINAVAIQMRDIITGREPMIFNPVRVFRAGKVKYEKAVHNEPVFEGPAPLYPDAYFHHYGYDLTPEEWKVKQERTIPLLKKRLELDPEDKRAHFFLSQSLAQVGDIDGAIEHAEQYIAHRNGSKNFQNSVYFTLVQLYIKKDDQKSALKTLNEAVNLLPNDLDLANLQTELGNMIKNPQMIYNGSMRFLHLYTQIKKNPASIGSQFVYSLTPEKYVFNAYNAMFLMVNEVVHLKRAIQNNLKLVSEEIRDTTLADMEREFGKFDMTIGGNDVI